MTKTVKMTRLDEVADVHPDEVENMKSHDWVIVEEKPARKKAVEKTNG